MAKPSWRRLIRLGLTTVMVALVLLGDDAVRAESDCEYAVDAYNKAAYDAVSAVDAYGNCVSNSRGTDDCNWYFNSINSAHNAFYNAVWQYKWKCQ